MSSFSERHGYVAKKMIQLESMDADLRTSLWNAQHEFFWQHVTDSGLGDTYPDDNLEAMLKFAWVHFFKWSMNDYPWKWENREGRVHKWYFGCEWHQVYSWLEFLAPFANDISNGATSKFKKYCNHFMTKEISAYQFVGDHIVPLTHKEEIAEVQRALLSPYDVVRGQIESAVSLFAKKPKPDLQNSIKESIGAVESAVRLATNEPNGTLGRLLPLLKEKIGLHDEQVEGFKHLYWWTSDDDSGIRHARRDNSEPTLDDARYMLVTCSAFANYVLRLSEQAGFLNVK